MKFAFYAVALLQAATSSQAVSLVEQPLSFEQSLAQTEAEASADNLTDALGKLVSSLQTDTGNMAGSSASAGPAGTTATGGVTPGIKGTNIAITTATDQHINIFVPEDPSGKVTVKKTEGVKVVDSDSDRGDRKNDATKAISKAATSKLIKRMADDSSEDDDAEDLDSKLKDVSKKIQKEKASSAKAKKYLEKATKAGKGNLAQTSTRSLTEEEIQELTFAQVESDSSSESSSGSNSGSESSSGSGSESSSGSSSGSESGSGSGSSSGSGSESSGESGSNSEGEHAQIGALELAQTEAGPAVRMTPQVHVQVTRVGYD